MFSRSLRWFLVGAAAALVLAATGAAVVAVRRGWVLAGEDEAMLTPEETFHEEPVTG